MERKRIIAVLAAAAAVIFLLCIAVIVSGVSYLRRRQSAPTPIPPQPILLCDEAPEDLCLLSFGADSLNHMVINLQVPDQDFPDFHAKLEFRSTTASYACKRLEDPTTSAYCTGERAPLGEKVVLRLYAVDDDRLLAEGAFTVGAILLPTFPVDVESTPTSEEAEGPGNTPGAPGTGTPGTARTRTPTPRVTSTPGPGYP